MNTSTSTLEATHLGITVRVERSDMGWKASIMCPPPGQRVGAATLELYRWCDSQVEALKSLWDMTESIHDTDNRFAARYAVLRFLNKALA